MSILWVVIVCKKCYNVWHILLYCEYVMSLTRREFIKGVVFVAGAATLAGCGPTSRTVISSINEGAKLNLHDIETEPTNFQLMSPQAQVAFNYSPETSVLPALPLDSADRIFLNAFQPPDLIDITPQYARQEIVETIVKSNLGLQFPADQIGQTIRVNGGGYDYTLKPGAFGDAIVNVVQGRDNLFHTVIRFADGNTVYTSRFGHGHMPINLRTTDNHYVGRHSGDVRFSPSVFEPVVRNLPGISGEIFDALEMGQKITYGGKYVFTPDLKFQIGSGRTCMICKVTIDEVDYGSANLFKQMTNPVHYYGFMPDYPIAIGSNNMDVTRFAAYDYYLNTIKTAQLKGKTISATDMRYLSKFNIGEIVEELTGRIKNMPNIDGFMISRGLRNVQAVSPSFLDVLCLRPKHLITLTDATGLDGFEYWSHLGGYALSTNILNADILTSSFLPETIYGEVNINKLREKGVEQGVLPIIKKYGEFNLPAFSVDNPDFIYALNVKRDDEGQSTVSLSLDSDLGSTEFFVANGSTWNSLYTNLVHVEDDENNAFEFAIAPVYVDRLPTKEEFIAHIGKFENNQPLDNNWDVTGICMKYNDEPLVNNVAHKIFSCHFITPDGQEKFMHVIIKINIANRV